MRVFKSFLTPHIESFIKFRKISERWNDKYEQLLHHFDDYCATFYPDSTDLSQEMVDKWCKQRDTENNSSCRKRIYVIINFVNYLRARDKSYVDSPVLPKSERSTYIPHAITEYELINFFNACDSLLNGYTLKERFRKIIVPVFFRLLYSSGIRVTEARLLRTVNVDLLNGVLDIQYTKGYNQHYVVLHDSMTSLLKQYDAAISKLCPDREFFFPSPNGKNYSKGWLSINFRQLWSKANNTHAVAYDFRHHYAINNINKWIGLGFEFDDKLLNLSKSMGHCDIEGTKYYYSLVPALADILEDKTNADFEYIVPEVYDEKV